MSSRSGVLLLRPSQCNTHSTKQEKKETSVSEKKNEVDIHKLGKWIAKIDTQCDWLNKPFDKQLVWGQMSTGRMSSGHVGSSGVGWNEVKWRGAKGGSGQVR